MAFEIKDLYNLRVILQGSHPVTGPYSSNVNTATSEVNNPNITKRRPVLSAEFLPWAAQNGRYLKIETASNDSGNLNVQNISKVTLVLLNGSISDLDLDSSNLMAMINALVTGDVLSAGDRNALFSLSNAPNISHGEKLGFGQIPRELVRGAIDPQLKVDSKAILQLQTINGSSLSVLDTIGEALTIIDGLNLKDGFRLIDEPSVNFDPEIPNQPSKLLMTRDSQWSIIE